METGKSHPYLLFMLGLSLLSLAMLAAMNVDGLNADQKSVLALADNMVCLLFFGDFLYTLHKAPNRLGYFLRWGWLDLLSCVPMVDALRVTRLARILRIIRLLRGAKILGAFLLARRAESAFMAMCLLAILLVVTCSIAILQVENVPGSTIRTAGDAVWWAITTITTVGYGDRVPTTTEGRLVASFLMLFGVGLFATLSGFIAHWFLKPNQRDQDSEMATLIAEVRALRERIDRHFPGDDSTE